jgi:hypothetical protein
MVLVVVWLNTLVTKQLSASIAPSWVNCSPMHQQHSRWDPFLSTTLTQWQFLRHHDTAASTSCSLQNICSISGKHVHLHLIKLRRAQPQPTLLHSGVCSLGGQSCWAPRVIPSSHILYKSLISALSQMTSSWIARGFFWKSLFRQLPWNSLMLWYAWSAGRRCHIWRFIQPCISLPEVIL